MYSEMVRYKEFFFVIQIELGTLDVASEAYQNTAFETTIFCMVNDDPHDYGESYLAKL